MSYHRCNGGRAALCSGYVAAGAIEEAGTGTAIVGDPIIALKAQLNRFAGKSFNPSGVKEPRRYVTMAFPLASGNLTDQQATVATIIVYDRYVSAPLEVYSAAKAAWAFRGLSGDTVAFVTANLAEITTTVAEYGDSLGLDPASVGITTRSPKFRSRFPYGTVALVGGLVVAAILVARKRR